MKPASLLQIQRKTFFFKCRLPGKKKTTRLRPSPADHLYFIFFRHWAAKTRDIGAGKNLAISFSWALAFCRSSATKGRLLTASKGHRGVRPLKTSHGVHNLHREGAPTSRVVGVPQERFDVPPSDRPAAANPLPRPLPLSLLSSPGLIKTVNVCGLSPIRLQK